MKKQLIILRSRTVVVAAALGILAGCAGTGSNPNVLSEEPYNQVKYAPTTKGLRGVGSVSVVTRGFEANIRHSIPALYQRALKEKTRWPASEESKSVYVSNIQTKVWTKMEMFDVPYQDCKMVTKMENVPYQNCRYVSGTGRPGSYGGNQCTTQYRMESRSKQECTQKTRKELREVLYQEATADVFQGA